MRCLETGKSRPWTLLQTGGFRLWWTTETGGDVAEAARVASVGRLGSLEVGEHEDVGQFGAGSGTEGVEALL